MARSPQTLNFAGSVWENLWSQFWACKGPCLLLAPRVITSGEPCSHLSTVLSTLPVPLKACLCGV